MAPQEMPGVSKGPPALSRTPNLLLPTCDSWGPLLTEVGAAACLWLQPKSSHLQLSAWPGKGAHHPPERLITVTG